MDLQFPVYTDIYVWMYGSMTAGFEKLSETLTLLQDMAEVACSGKTELLEI